MQSPSKKRSLADCSYAAGLAVARWYFGFPADAVAMGESDVPVAEVRAETRRHSGDILITGPSIATREAPDVAGQEGAALEWQRRCGLVLAETELVVLATGYRGPVEQRGQSGVDRWRRKHPEDFERARTLADRIADDPMVPVQCPRDPGVHLELACVRARALLRPRNFDDALHWLARDLRMFGRVDGDRIHEYCSDYLGGFAPARAAWAQSWPSSLEELMCAHVPYLDINEEDLIERTYEQALEV